MLNFSALVLLLLLLIVLQVARVRTEDGLREKLERISGNSITTSVFYYCLLIQQTDRYIFMSKQLILFFRSVRG